MGTCQPPKSVTVRPYWRAKARKHSKGPKAGTTYYVAENEHGQTCEHKHRTWSGAHACAARHNRTATRTRGRKAASWLTEKRKA